MKHPAVMKHLIVDICCLSMIFGVTSSAYAADIAGIDSVKPSDSASSATASPAEQASEEESPSDKRAGETEPKAANTPITSSGATSADTAEKKTDAKTGSKPNGSSEPADPLTGWKTVG
ncbi:hypothetical protein, partial [Bifidobacterium sp. UBA744]|uniref:hypothetical protein n=1 Tax=Bifidobacterium sp. UBA744 TaxID=1946112 RepID=UPI0025C326D6